MQTEQQSLSEIWEKRKSRLMNGLRVLGILYVVVIFATRPSVWIILGTFLLVSIVILLTWGIALHLEKVAIEEDWWKAELPRDTKEFDIPLAKIPNGYEELERDNLTPDNEPSEDALLAFFTQEMIRRLVVCPQINIDLIDDWERFGHEPGYFFICKRNYKGVKRLSDLGILKGNAIRYITMPNGQKLMWAPNWATYPHYKYLVQVITSRRTPRTYAFLEGLFKQHPQE